MPLVSIPFGKVYGAPFRGLQLKIADAAQSPGEAADGHDFRTEDGVLASRKGSIWAFDTTRPTGYAAVLDGSSGVKFPHIDAYDLLVRWTIIFSFRTPASFPATGYLFSKRVTVGGTPYKYPAIYVNSSGKVYVELTSAAGVSKTFHSGANVLSTSTNYVIQVMRYDTNCYLYWWTPTTAPAVKGSTDALGKINYPVSSADHPFIVGADWTGAAYASALAIEAHELTVLSKVVEHRDFGLTSFGAPRDRDCVLHCRFEDASSHLTDLSANGNHSDNEAGVSAYRSTTNVFVQESCIVNLVKEFTSQDKQQRVLVVSDGNILAANYHI